MFFANFYYEARRAADAFIGCALIARAFALRFVMLNNSKTLLKKGILHSKKS